MHFNRLYHSTFIKKLRKKHFLILGLSKRTGWKMVQFFSDLNIPYSVSDLSISFQCFQALKKLNKPPMRIFSGFQTPSQLENISDIVTAPGVPKDIPIILQAKKKSFKSLV